MALVDGFIWRLPNLLSNIKINFCDVIVFPKLNSSVTIYFHISAAIGRLVLAGDLWQAVRDFVSCSEFLGVRGRTLLCVALSKMNKLYT